MRKLSAFIIAVVIGASSGATLGVRYARAASTLSCSNPTKLSYPQQKSGTINYPNGLTVQQDFWSPGGRAIAKQTMLVCSPSSWTSTDTISGTPNDGVATYPDTLTTYPSSCSAIKPIGAFKSSVVSYATTPPTAKATWDYAYDVFLGGGPCKDQPFREVMFWHRWASSLSVPTAQLHPVIGGVAYDVFHSKTYVQVRDHVQTTSGTRDIMPIMRYLISKGIVNALQERDFVGNGYEVLTTYSMAVTFPFNAWSLVDTFNATAARAALR